MDLSTIGEDLDLTTPFITTQDTRTNDLVSIGELQFGFGWKSTPGHGQVWQPFATIALEGQFWNGPGNASSATGNLGFFGFTSGIGVNW